MEKVKRALEEIKEINQAYGISNDSLMNLQQEMETAKVCTPLIGKFSSEMRNFEISFCMIS